MNTKHLLFALAGVSLAVMPASTLADPQYHIETLTYPGSDDVTPTAISGGFISGNAYTDAGLNAAIWTPGGIQTLSGPDGASLLGVAAVNGSGDAVGTAGGGRGAPTGVWWHNGNAEYLPSEDGDSDETEYLYGSRAVGINSFGTIIGNAETQYGDVGVVWSAGQVQLLMSLDPITDYQHSIANSINESNQIVGAANSGGMAQAVIWEDGTPHLIGGLGQQSGAEDINDFGTIVGWTLNGDGSTNGFFSDGTTTTLLPTLAGLFYGDAAAINNAGIIVGSSGPDGVGESTATLWKDGIAYDLNSFLGPEGAGWDLISAVDIDNDGTIVGFGRYQGEYRSFVLKPVPEPASMIALACGLAAFARKRRRR